MYATQDFRTGLKILWEGEPYVIVEFQHVKPGKGGAFVRSKIRNVRTGAVIDKTFNAGIKVEQVVLQDVNPPDQVKPSFNEVNEAQQERERLINEAQSEYKLLAKYLNLPKIHNAYSS